MRDDYKIFETLSRHAVPFVIVGGHAVNHHGHIRLTEDADVVWVRSPAAEIALSGALTEIDAQYIGREIDPATGIERTYPVGLAFVQSRQLMMLCTRFGFLDLFSYVPGHPKVNVDELYDSSVVSNGFHYASLEWLRKMKVASGRTKDLLDLDELPKE